MDPLTDAKHRRRTIILALVLGIGIPILNTFLQKWGLPPLPPISVPPPVTTSSSTTVTGTTGDTTENPPLLMCRGFALSSESATASNRCRPTARRTERREARFQRRHPHLSPTHALEGATNPAAPQPHLAPPQRNA